MVRKEEFQRLQEVYFQAQQAGAKPQLVLISGPSGTGKTHLCQEWKKAILKSSGKQQNTCLFAESKFEQQQEQQQQQPQGLSSPFSSAILQAFTDLCEQLQALQHLQTQKANFQDDASEASDTAAGSVHDSSPLLNGDTGNHIRQDILTALEGEEANAVRLLIQFIPALAPVLQIEEPLDNKDFKEQNYNSTAPTTATSKEVPQIETREVDVDTAEMGTIIMSLVRSLLKGICRPTRPVLLFLDDLQWADSASQQLLHGILSDDDICNFVFVGAITTAGGEQDTATTSQRQSTTVTNMFPANIVSSVVDITLHNLDLGQLNQILCSILELQQQDDANTKNKINELATVILSKTAGNLSHVIQFLEKLSQEKLIFFSRERGEWSWDISAITAKTDVSDTVAELLVSHVQTQNSKEVNIMLAMAACLGYSFDSKHLLAVLVQQEKEPGGLPQADEEHSCDTPAEQHSPTTPLSTDSRSASKQPSMGVQNWMDHCLNYAVEAKFLEVVPPPGVFKFSHTKVHQCFYSIMSERCHDDIQWFHLNIGRIIRNQRNLQDQSSIFLAVDQMNRGASLLDGDDERIDLMGLNITAGKQARSLSAFIPAAEYLKKARELGVEGDWMNHYDLRLELFLLSAETEYSCGNHQSVMPIVDEVLENAQNLEDKARAFYVRVGSLGTQGRYDEATKEACRVLTLLGARIQARPGLFRVVYEFIKTRKQIGLRDAGELRNLPNMTGWKNCTIMKFLVLADLFSTLSQQQNLQAVIFFRQVQHTLTNGLSAGAGNTFANYGIVLALLGNHAKAFEFGRLALAVAEDWQDQTGISAAYLRVFGYLNHYRQPLSNALEPLLSGYRVGIESDTGDFASFCLLLYLELYLVMGLPLQPYLEDIDRFLQRLDETRQEAALLLSHPSRNFARAITLLPPKKPPGEDTQRQKGFDVVKPTFLIFKMYLAYLKRNDEKANQILRALTKVIDPASSRSFLFAYLYRLVGGLVSHSMYRKKREQKYWNRATDAKNWFKRLAKDGDVNAFCMMSLLHAEEASFYDSMNKTRKVYDQAIVSLTQGGFIAFAAIANERAGDTMVRNFKDAFWAGHYYRKALGLYKDWGALLKVRQLTSLVEDPDNFNDRSMLSLRGRTRFDDVRAPTTSLEIYSTRSQNESKKESQNESKESQLTN